MAEKMTRRTFMKSAAAAAAAISLSGVLTGCGGDIKMLICTIDGIFFRWYYVRRLRHQGVALGGEGVKRL